MRPATLGIERVTKRSALRITVALAGVAAVISLALEYGFYEPPVAPGVLLVVQFAAVAVYLASRVFEIVRVADRWAAIRSSWIDGVMFAAAMGVVVALLERPGPILTASVAYVAAMQVALLVRVGVEAVKFHLWLSQRSLHPTRVLALTFVILILGGTIALALPRATHFHPVDGGGASQAGHLLNCAFTATSAVCVTGLAVYDAGSDFTPFGQVVLLVLMQAGGLGIMIFGSVFGMLLGRHLSLKQSLVLQDTISYRTLGHMRAMIIFIVVLTFSAEAIGAVLLYPMWEGIEDPYRRLFCSVFHSVSAFCNAGFSLQPDSLSAYSRAWQVYGCVVPLVVLGGLGFPVLHGLWCGLRSKLELRKARGSASVLPKPHRMTLHTKLVLVSTLILVVVPAVGFWVFELLRISDGAPAVAAHFGESSGAGRVLDAFFYSITCRTAGFSTIPMDLDSMSPASHFLAMILMFIGGSPASTAGGIKTVGIAVLLLGVWATLRGRPKVEAFGRTIPEETVRRAAVVTIVMLGVVGAVTLAILFTEGVSLRSALFESVSACGTVGLSTGLTPELTAAGRVVIIAAMFAGRLGPLTLLIALAGRSRPARYEYPEEPVGIG